MPGSALKPADEVLRALSATTNGAPGSLDVGSRNRRSAAASSCRAASSSTWNLCAAYCRSAGSAVMQLALPQAMPVPIGWTYCGCTGGEAAGESVQRIVLVQVQKQRDQRHAHRHAVGGLLEIDRAAVAVERGVELVDARQRVHDACIRIFRLAEEFGVDLRIGPVLVGPALFLESGDIDRVDLLLELPP